MNMPADGYFPCWIRVPALIPLLGNQQQALQQATAEKSLLRAIRKGKSWKPGSKSQTSARL